MAKKTDKTNAARLLDKAGISYKLIPYEFDENDLAAQHVADSLGQPIERVFKTLVLHGDKTGQIVCVVPGNGEVDLKALAKKHHVRLDEYGYVMTAEDEALEREFQREEEEARREEELLEKEVEQMRAEQAAREKEEFILARWLIAISRKRRRARRKKRRNG